MAELFWLGLAQGWGPLGHLYHQIKDSAVLHYLESVLFCPETLAPEPDMFQKGHCSVKGQRQPQLKLVSSYWVPLRNQDSQDWGFGKRVLQKCWSFSPQSPILSLQTPPKACRLLTVHVPWLWNLHPLSQGKILSFWSLPIPCKLYNLDANEVFAA